MEDYKPLPMRSSAASRFTPYISAGKNLHSDLYIGHRTSTYNINSSTKKKNDKKGVIWEDEIILPFSIPMRHWCKPLMSHVFHSD